MLPVEGWNAQISLMTGQAAAELMLKAELGVLRTLPEASRRAVERLRRTAKALGIEWKEEQTFADVIRDLDPKVPAHAAFLVESTVLLRGSGYAAFDDEVPSQPAHAGVGAPYAHTTAPLRRLVDRYVGEVCVAVCAGEDVPDVGADGAARAAADDGGVEPAGAAVRGRDHLDSRGGRAGAAASARPSRPSSSRSTSTTAAARSS